MIGHVVAGDELHRFARAGDEEVAGNAQVFDDAVKRMFRFGTMLLVKVSPPRRAVFDGGREMIVDDRESDGSPAGRGSQLGEKACRRTRPAAVVPSVHDACPYCL